MTILPLASSSWRFRDCSGRDWLPAVVPGCVHDDLRRAGKIPDPYWGTHEADLQWIEERDWEYAASFDADAELLEGDAVTIVARGKERAATLVRPPLWPVREEEE